MMLVVLVVVFAALLGLTLLVVSVPALVAGRTARSARLEEVLRYRAPLGQPEVAPKRAAKVAPPSPTVVAQKAVQFADRTLRSRGLRGDVVAELEGAGLRIRPEEWAIIHLSVCAALAAVLYVGSGSIFGVPLGAAAGWFGGRAYLKFRRSRREAAFLAQIPETLQLVAGSLHAGFSLGQALGTVVREGSEPTAGEFNRALTEARLGANLEDALEGVADRMRCEDLAWVVMAIRISREVGGNLAEVLGNTVATMRSRAELRGLVKTLSAEGRISARVLEALPFALGTFLWVTNPTYLTPLFHTGTGIALLVGGAVMLTIGFIWISRLVKVEM